MINQFKKVITCTLLVISTSAIGASAAVNNYDVDCNENCKSIEVKNDNVSVNEDGELILTLSSENNYGFRDENGKIQFYDITGTMVKSKLICIGGQWYYFNTDGNMTTGWVFIENNWYHFRENGMMNTGWLYDNGSWFYMDPAGIMQKSKWVCIDQKLYYFDDSGILTDKKNI